MVEGYLGGGAYYNDRYPFSIKFGGLYYNYNPFTNLLFY